MGHAIGVLVGSHSIARLGQCAAHKGILGIHDGRLRVGLCVTLDLHRGAVACHQDGAPLLVALDGRLSALVVLEQLDGQVAR